MKNKKPKKIKLEYTTKATISWFINRLEINHNDVMCIPKKYMLMILKLNDPDKKIRKAVFDFMKRYNSIPDDNNSSFTVSIIKT